MSAEGKKKRGEAGRANALSKPFRLGGRPCDYSTVRRPGAASHPYWNGSRLLAAFEAGAMLHARYPFETSGTLAARIETALARFSR